ncbi:cell division protein CrgA [Nocardia wallacei]|uniref:Cell division protein CrgA n=2 Tax=Nocardia wallacei TaxID=480035 RepID=A0A7G1KFP4_9NOCA|nr:cell division protein CrgA [Nocardia wallacei]
MLGCLPRRYDLYAEYEDVMPKSKVRRKKTDYTINPASRTPVKVKGGPSPVWYVCIMLGFMLAGLVWLLVYYLANDKIEWMANLNAWNFLIGFGLMVIGLIMTMRWR